MTYILMSTVMNIHEANAFIYAYAARQEGIKTWFMIILHHQYISFSFFYCHVQPEGFIYVSVLIATQCFSFPRMYSYKKEEETISIISEECTHAVTETYVNLSLMQTALRCSPDKNRPLRGEFALNTLHFISRHLRNPLSIRIHRHVNAKSSLLRKKQKKRNG